MRSLRIRRHHNDAASHGAPRLRLVPRHDVTARVSLGLAIRRLREREGLSRRELARYAEIEHAALRRFERGEEFPSFEVLLAIAGAMVVPLTALIGHFENEHYRLSDR